MAVSTMVIVLAPHASVIEGGLDVIVLSFIVMTYTTVLAMVDVWDQTYASVHRDFL